MSIDPICRSILADIGIVFVTTIEELVNKQFNREMFLNMDNYEIIRPKLAQLKHVLSSSALTSLHKSADTKQKYPLLNLARQILKTYGYKMKPIRKSAGYTTTGIKKYRRFFLLSPYIVGTDIDNESNTTATSTIESCEDHNDETASQNEGWDT